MNFKGKFKHQMCAKPVDLEKSAGSLHELLCCSARTRENLKHKSPVGLPSKQIELGMA